MRLPSRVAVRHRKEVHRRGREALSKEAILHQDLDFWGAWVEGLGLRV